MWPKMDLNLAMTVDGRLCQDNGDFGNFTSPYDKWHMGKLRAKADGVCIGAATLRQVNPPMHIRDAKLQAWRVRHGRPAALPVLIFTQTGQLDLDWQIWRHQQPVYICCGASTALPASLPATCHIVRSNSEAIDLQAILQQLYQLGFRQLLAEGGPTMAAQWLAIGAIRYLYVTIAPYLFGGVKPITLVRGSLPASLQLQLQSAHQVEHEIFCKYLVLSQPSDQPPQA